MSADGAAPAPAAGRRDDGGKRPRLGLRDELLFLVPAAVLLLVVLSTFTLFSYRSALLRLRDERQQEAARLARGVADRLLAAGPAGGAAVPSPDRLRLLAPGARTVALLDARGMALAAAGELQPLQLPEAGPAAGPGATPRLRPFATGPDADLPDAVAGFAPLLVRLAGSAPAGASAAPGPAASGAPAAVLYVRLDLDAATLGAQLRAIRLLCWLVLPVNSALVVLVLLLLRRLLTPYETLLARARQLGQPAAAGEDEAEFLIATLERALEALGERQRALAGAYQEGQEGQEGQQGQEGRRADDDLAAIERTLAASLESGLLLLGRDGRVLSLNALGAALLGAAPPAAGALPPLAGELLAPHPELLALVDTAIALGRPVNRQECTLRGPAGEALTLGLSVHPLRRDDGAARGYLVLFADLTEARRRAEESRLNDRLATLGEMAAGVAHELRNSLATLRGYLTLIERRPDEESIADFLAEIRRESDHLQRVLEDFLAFARPGTARLQLFSMQALAHRAAADPALAGVEVEVRAAGRQAAARAPGAEPPAEAPLLGDPQLIERALRNVLHNAAQAEREAGRRGPVEVLVEDLPAGVEVTVADRGQGVPPEVRD
ncbi:MAG TPA: histidine kinase dimerization/phospho-acceptor domain-containing protein, partial [Thermoanaerobaculia bacterium]|nr:histidine kinase dimerization/phospho-acceptor domain-containing protein [Thermoanaerobaculia bacterium]